MHRLTLWAVSVLIFTIPWENLVVFGGDTTITRYVGYAVLIACVLSFACQGRVRRLHPAHLLIFMFVGYAALSLAWTIDSDSSLQAALSQAQLLVMTILIWQVTATVDGVHHLMKAYVLGGCVAVASTVQSFLFDNSRMHERYISGGFDPNDLALTLVISIPIACFLASRSGTSRWARLYYVYVGAALFAIGLTASRGGALATLTSLIALPFTWMKQRGRHRVIALLLGVAVIAVALHWVPDSSWKRLATIDSEVTRGTLNYRTQIWDAGLRTFENDPFIGVGAGAFKSSNMSSGMVAHNTYISVLAEGGLIAAFIGLAIMVSLMRTTFCMPKDIRATWLVLFAAIAIGISVLSWLERKPFWFAIALVLAHASARSHEDYNPIRLSGSTGPHSFAGSGIQ